VIACAIAFGKVNSIPSLQKKRDTAQKTEDEFTQAEKKQRRASNKRVQKRKAAEREEQEGIASNPKGIKSAREDAVAAKQAKLLRKVQKGRSCSRVSSGQVFQKLHNEQEVHQSRRQAASSQ
jgi:hypothetical protein